MSKVVLGFVLLLSVAPGVSSAQERLVPFDSLGHIERIDRNLEQRLKLFPEYPAFREAVLFQVADSAYTLEIVYEDSGRVLRSRRALDPEELSALRTRIMAVVAERAPGSKLDRSGRKPLIAGNLTLALCYHGWALPAAAEMDNGTAIGGIWLITGAAGYFVPMLVTEHASVSRGMSTMALYGASRGIGHGIALGYLVSGEDPGSWILSLGTAASLVEEIAFAGAAKKNDLSDGDAKAIGVFGDFGAGMGAGVAHLADAYRKGHERTAAACILGGSAAGLMTGAVFARRLTYTRGDAYILRAAGLLGAGIPIAIVDWSNPDDDRVYTAAAMAGSVCGLAAGHALIRGYDFETDDATLITLGAAAGGLIGVGFVTLASPKGKDASAYCWTAATVGGAAGLAVSYASLKKSAPPEALNNVEIGLDWAGLPRNHVSGHGPDLTPLLTARLHF